MNIHEKKTRFQSREANNKKQALFCKRKSNYLEGCNEKKINQETTFDSFLLLGTTNLGLFHDSLSKINAKVVIYGIWQVLYNNQGEYIGERGWKTPSTCVVVIQNQ